VHALLSDPGEAGDTRSLRCPGVAFRKWYAVGPCMLFVSRLDHTAYTLAVYASQPRSPSRHARLASGWGPALSGRGWVPAGLQ
jgi:hypothetical protein